MELLNPPYPPHLPSSLNAFHGFYSSSSLLLPMVIPRLRGVVEEASCDDDDGADFVYVAIGKSVEKSASLLRWTFRRFRDKQIRLLHVHQLSSVIPTLLGKLPASQANTDVVAAYRKKEWEQTSRVLENYLGFCHRTKVKAGIVLMEAEQVHTGIVDLVNKFKVRKLVMGTMADSCVKVKVKKSSSKADYAARNIPFPCEIWFVNKGKHVWTREAVEGSSSASSLFLPELAITENFPAQSSLNDESHSFNLEDSQSSSANAIIEGLNCINKEPFDVEGVVSSSSDRYFPCPLQISSSPASSSSDSGHSSVEGRESTSSDSRVEERGLYGELKDAVIEAEASRNEAIEMHWMCRKMEQSAAESIKKFKVFKCVNEHEIDLRKEIERMLRTTIEKKETLSEERTEILEELERTLKTLTLLDTQTRQVTRKHEEAITELKIIQASIAALRKEKQTIQSQKIDALNWLSKWKHEKAASANYNRSIGFVENQTQLAEFSLLELQTATCGFSESFKIAQGGYGCLYKGEMLGKTVAIRKLHPHYVLGPAEFQNEVEVLGKLQHPHLVTLLGVCTEACSLVYEYFPHGNLQNHLFPKGNTPPLTWKTRARIIAEIASALCFLHSSKPENTVHGDLKPENILLDSEFISKICDFGIYRLISEDTLYCPSFRRSTEPKGAFSYTDPECQRDGVLTPKSDVYSFGLIILQLLTGKPIVGLVGELRKAISFGQLESVLDLSAGEWPIDVAKRFLDIGLQCCELKGSDRPELTPSLVRELKQLHVSEERPVPSYFLCPILQEIMLDPQVAADGFTYEGEAIREWLSNGRETSPMTNLKLSHPQLTPNHAVRLAIQDWLSRV
ncbi:U-box domain-containing protein 33-like [Cucurbita maxima]|uniref:RING-type E3 ubiquitin transferase n=1 Tax=Cucurbita maxima TaxID=3661 RepID=A0A6J1L2W3_CUCMA|nr:U-box domain-containing protein 33-like [Cucurbita maxima]